MSEVTEPPVAELAECIAAIEALSDDQWGILKRYAAFMAFYAWGVLYSADAEDLVHEAIARTLDGIRKWRPQNVDFMTYLKGCIRSIADEYAKEGKRHSGSAEEYDGQHFQEEFKEEHIFRKMVFEALLDLLKPDAVAFKVCEALLGGFTPAEIRQTLNIDKSVYNAARKRISRALYKLLRDKGESL